MFLWSISIQPRRATLRGEATLPCLGYEESLTDSHNLRERWRD